MEALGLEEIPEIIPAEEIMGLRQTAECHSGDPGVQKKNVRPVHAQELFARNIDALRSVTEWILLCIS